MKRIQLRKQKPEPIDDATRAALEKAEESFRRGEGITLEQARIEIRKEYEAWLKSQKRKRSA